jgi:hypothetical protein
MLVTRVVQTFLIVAATAALGAACGGGQPRLSKQAYEAKLRAVGPAMQASLVKSLPALTSGGVHAHAYAAALSKTLARTADTLGSLRPPADAEADNAKLAAGLRLLSTQVVRLVEADAWSTTLRSPQLKAMNAAAVDLRPGATSSVAFPRHLRQSP